MNGRLLPIRVWICPLNVRSAAEVSKPKAAPVAKFVVPISVAASASVTPWPTVKAAPAATEKRPFVFQPGRAAVEAMLRVPCATVVVVVMVMVWVLVPASANVAVPSLTRPSWPLCGADALAYVRMDVVLNPIDAPAARLPVARMSANC